MGGHANSISAMLLERLRYAKWRFHLGNGVANDEVNARGAAEVFEHGLKRL